MENSMGTNKCHMSVFIGSMHSFCRFVAFVTVLSCTEAIFAVASAESPGPPCPDVFSCTKIEIRFTPSTLAYVEWNEEVDVLNSDERKYLESLKKIVCSDKMLIGRFAHSLSLGHYAGSAQGVRMKFPIHIVGYQDDKCIQSFKMNARAVTTEAGHLFEYAGGFPYFHHLVPQLWPYQMRIACAYNLLKLGLELQWLKEIGRFPKVSEWCDAIVQRRKGLGLLSKIPVRSDFECPSANSCHFALNDQFTPGSRLETVVLFESRPGWNQHGGPGLFTTGNHKPRGGLVLSMKGEDELAVQFIRTQEDARKLRWK